jgi:hypothetical protein
MTLKPLLCCLLLAAVPCGAQPSAFQITGSVKRLEKSDGLRMDVPRGTIKSEEEEKVLKLEIRRTNPTVADEVNVRWLVLLKDPSGQLRPATRGLQAMKTAVGTPHELQSDPFTLRSRSFDGNHPGVGGKLEQEVAGYGVLILDADGKEMASRFQPSSVEQSVRAEWAKEAAAPKAPPAPPGPPGPRVPRRLRP